MKGSNGRHGTQVSLQLGQRTGWAMIPEETSIGVDSGLTLIKHVTNYLHLDDVFAHNQVGGQKVFKHFLEYTPL